MRFALRHYYASPLYSETTSGDRLHEIVASSLPDK
jgi:hypothetical protein